MGELIEFPLGEPEGEAPQIGYCMGCGMKVAWPNDSSAWPESCPNGCTPFSVQSEPLGTWGNITAQGGPLARPE